MSEQDKQELKRTVNEQFSHLLKQCKCSVSEDVKRVSEKYKGFSQMQLKMLKGDFKIQINDLEDLILER